MSITLNKTHRSVYRTCCSSHDVSCYHLEINLYSRRAISVIWIIMYKLIEDQLKTFLFLIFLFREVCQDILIFTSGNQCEDLFLGVSARKICQITLSPQILKKKLNGWIIGFITRDLLLKNILEIIWGYCCSLMWHVATSRFISWFSNEVQHAYGLMVI